MTERRYDNPLARMLRDARAESGWTRKEAANHMQLSPDFLKDIETGASITRRQITLDRIADTYNLVRNDVLAAALASKARTPANPDQPPVAPQLRRNDNPFADRIYQWRIHHKITRRQAAERIGISVGYLSGLENGTQSTRNEDVIRKIAYIYGIDFGDLWDLTPQKNIETERRREREDSHAPPRKLTDDEWAARKRIPPDIIAWLRADREHVRKVRKLMSKGTTTSPVKAR